MSLDTLQAREIRKAEKHAGKLINGCSTQSGQSILIMDDGTIVSSPKTAQELTSCLRELETVN